MLKYGWKISLLLFTLLLFSCKTLKPIEIKPLPDPGMSEGMTKKEYIEKSTRWKIEVTKWIEDLINQIKNRVPYIDIE